MNKRIIIGIIGLAIIVLLVVFAVVILSGNQNETQPNATQNPSSFPIATNTSTSSSTQTIGFLNHPDVHPDPDNADYYFIGYQPSRDEDGQSVPFVIQYMAESQYFTIGLNEEPLGENRRNAEKKLMQVLGISKDKLCSLRYAVYVANTVNSQYSGMNLGFSTCPGAVQLPQ